MIAPESTISGEVGVPTAKPDGKVLMRVRGISKAFGGQAVLDMTDSSLELRRGEVVLLRGANGSGKTTLLNILTGNLEPDTGSIELFTADKRKSFHFPRVFWRELTALARFAPERIAASGVGRTWQETRLFSTQNLRNNIAVATPNQLGERPAKVPTRPFAVRRQETNVLAASDKVLENLGLRGRETSSADKISLGQAKRVAIASAVQAGAQILFLDEPLASLDASGMTEVMGLLERLVRERQITLVIIEHVFNIQRILRLATTVWTLDNGRIKVEDPSTVRQERSYFGRNGIQEWMLEVVGPNVGVSQQELAGGAKLTAITPAGAILGDLVLEVKNVAVRRGKRLVIGSRQAAGLVEGVSFTLRRGQLYVLQAPNGWGKTTLLEAIAGTLPILQGDVLLNGVSLHNTPFWKRAQMGISFLQARDNEFPNLKVREILWLAGVTGLPARLEPLENKKMSDLSGGEKQSVSLACVMGRGRFNLGLFDEPFSSQDSEAVRRTTSLLSEALTDSTLLIATPLVLEGTAGPESQA